LSDVANSNPKYKIGAVKSWQKIKFWRSLCSEVRRFSSRSLSSIAAIAQLGCQKW
jgi:hypothetical protein